MVHPHDREGILEAIQINTFLWGGTFNPIIPAFDRIPSRWTNRASLTSKKLIEGYLDAFDPDYVVKVGKRATAISVGKRNVLQAAEILEGLERDWTPNYGVGLFEILSHLADEEFRFVRREPLNIHLAEHDGRNRIFLAALFGDLSERIANIFLDSYEKVLDVRKIKCSVYNYPSVLENSYPFVRQVTGLYRADLRRAQMVLYSGCLFFLDANSALDVIDYWNLRALGWKVIPIAIQSMPDARLMKIAASFIDKNYFPHHFNPKLHFSTVLIKSRSAPDKTFERFFEKLRQVVVNEPERPRIVRQNWYPRIWDQWEREGDFAKPSFLDAGSGNRDFTVNGQEIINIKSLDPDFLESLDGPSAHPRFANQVSLRIYGEKELYAEVIPEAGDELQEAFGGFDIRNLRFSKTGAVYLCSHLESSIYLYPPKADQVFAGWMKSQGWTVDLSDKGRIAKQILKQLGGQLNTRFLENERIVQLLERMSGGKVVKENELKAEGSRIAKETRWKDPSWLIRVLTSKGILQLGMEFRCPICTQRSWYSIKEADYELQCYKCLEKFEIPSSTKDVKWAYRSLGPFSLPNYAFGAYPVLFTLSFLHRSHIESKTPHFSFTAVKGSEKFEVDLALLFHGPSFGATNVGVIFAECKTYAYFKDTDIRRLRKLGVNFPGAILLFSTLRTKLTNREKTILRAAVNRNRALANAGKPFNPIMILTAKELLSDFGAPLCWERTGATATTWHYHAGDKTMLNLCDITQQLYLDMQSWNTLLNARW